MHFLRSFSNIAPLTIVSMMLLAAGTVPVLAQGGGELLSPLEQSASTAGFLLLLPLGLLLLTASALPDAERDAPAAATSALVVWGVAVLAFFAAGFALAFGGVAVSNPHPDFADLFWNWSPLAPSFGPNWGFAGLRGWALLGPAATPGVYDLFLRHIALLGVVTVLPTVVLFRRMRGWMLVAFGVVAGTLLYSLPINWVWSRGWLANLGLNLGLGHGFVDAGLATPFAIAGMTTLLALVILRPPAADAVSPADDPPAAADSTTSGAGEFVETPLPSAYLPLLSFFGLGMILWSWAFISNGQHIPTFTELAIPRAALNGFLGAFAGLTAAALYSRFVTTRFDGLLLARGGLAGLALVSAAAPFMVPWEAVAAGLLAGLLLPFVLYLVDHRLELADHTGSVASLAVMGVLGWLLVGLVADGTGSAGWNGVGTESYLGVAGQGVSGLLVAAGRAIDWPGQMNAQLIGTAAIVLWTALIAGGLFRMLRWAMNRVADEV